MRYRRSPVPLTEPDERRAHGGAPTFYQDAAMRLSCFSPNGRDVSARGGTVRCKQPGRDERNGSGCAAPY